MSLTKVSYSMITGAPVNVIDYGADPTGVADSTSAINAAITYAITFNGEVVFPAGTYKVTDTIKMFCAFAGQGVNLTGQGGGRSDGTSRASLLWYGNSATAPVLHLRGAGTCVISNINIQSKLIDSYPYFGGIFVQSGQNFGGPGSSGVQIRNCVVNGGKGTNSYAVRLGEDNLQVSECFCENVLAQSSNSGSAYISEYGFIVTANNTKDMSFYGCGHSFFTKAGVYYELGVSGWHIWENLGGSSFADFYVNGSGNLTIIGGGSEGSNKALIQFGGGSNPGTITMRGYQAEALVPADAYFIEMGQSNLILEGCSFNCNPPATPFYIKYPDAALADFNANTNQSLVSVGNWYQNATTFIPVWSYGPINSTITGASSLAPVRVFSTGDKGGEGGSIVHLPTVYGDNPQKFASLSYTSSNWYTTRALPFSASVKGVSTVIQKYTIPYTYLVDASLTANFAFLDIQAGGKVVGVYANVTQAFVLGASTISLAIGYGGSSNEFILTKAVSGFTGPIGQADADLGTALARATAVQSGYVNLSGTTTVTAKFTSTVGNFGSGAATTATAGNVIIYVAVQDFS